MATGLPTSFEILLVIFFRAIESLSGYDFSYDWSSEFAACLQFFFMGDGNLFLFR